MPWQKQPPVVKLMNDITNQSKPYIDFSQKSLLYAALAIAFNPIFWNIVARAEYRTHFLTKLFRGNAYYGCYFLAVIIFSIGILRDTVYERALRHQPIHPAFTQPYLAYSLLAIGNTLVLSSMWALGITGTYLGDYFGILMDAPVTGFPFNVMGAPMYWGSCMSFAGSALLYGRPAGLLLTLEIFLMYSFALIFEDPFTMEIYKKRDRERARAGKGKGKKTK